MKFLRIVFLVILAIGLAYSQQFSNGILLTNESSSVGPNGLLQYENDNLGISIESPVNWNIVEETNSTSFSPYTDSLFGPHVTIRTRNSDPNIRISELLMTLPVYHLEDTPHMWYTLVIQNVIWIPSVLVTN